MTVNTLQSAHQNYLDKSKSQFVSNFEVPVEGQQSEEDIRTHLNFVRTLRQVQLVYIAVLSTRHNRMAIKYVDAK